MKKPLSVRKVTPGVSASCIAAQTQRPAGLKPPVVSLKVGLIPLGFHKASKLKNKEAAVR